MNNIYKLNKRLSHILILMMIVCSPAIAEGQIITTLAGDGSFGASGDGKFASFATLNTPSGLAIDKSGNIYIAEQYNNKIRKINAYGVLTTVAGTGSGGMSGDGGPSEKAKVNYPAGMTVDKAGNLYFADSRNNRIRKIDTSGIISTVAGTGVPGFSKDDTLAIHSQLNQPRGVAIDADGNMYIADCSNNRIRKVNTAGIITTIAGQEESGFKGDDTLAITSKLSGPCDVAVLADGSIIIADTYNNAIRKINTSGIITTIAGSKTGHGGFGGDGGLPGSSKLFQPMSLAVDHLGNIFFADKQNNRVRKIDASGVVNTVAGNGSSGSAQNGDGGKAVDAQIFLPTSVAVDSAGNLYIGETKNRVRYVYLDEIKESSDITVFPNPCVKDTHLFLPCKHAEIATIFVLNMQGRVVSKTIAPTNMYVNLRFDVPGAYAIYAVSKHGEWKGRVIALQ